MPALITYRRANINDLYAVYGLALELCSLLPEPFKAIDLYKSHKLAFQSKSYHCFIALHDGLPIGVLSFFLAPELRNHSVVTAHEADWYVRPEFKGIGVRLVKYVEKYLNCDRIDFGIAEPRLQQLLTLLGYKPVKTIMRKEIRG